MLKYEQFKDIARDKTVIFVTHRLNTVALADKIIFLDEGSMICHGTHDQLMLSCKKYKEMFDKQSESFFALASNK